MKIFPLLQTEDRLSILDEEIRERHGWQSFQRPDKIADALRLITTIKLWDELAKEMKTEARTIKGRLELIVERRDKIAHEADTMPHSERLPDKRWTINKEMTLELVEFIEKVVEAIYRILIRNI